jgi:hypothetical protein
MREEAKRQLGNGEKSIKRGVSNMRIKVALLLCFATLLSNILVSAEIELVYSDY